MTIDLPIRLTLYNSLQAGAEVYGDVTAQLWNTWRRTIRAVGGYWIGSARWEGSTAEMLDIFQNGLQYEIRETAQGITTWEGFIAEMYMRHQGIHYYRAWPEVSNRIKTIYSKIGVNLLSNPGVESAMWDAYNSPSKRERSTAWATQGNYSGRVVADSVNDGVKIQNSIKITARKAYSARITVKILSGSWRLEIYDSNDNIIDSVDESAAGQSVLYAGVPENNAATTVGMRLYCTTSSGEIYADAAVFQLAPTRAETTWYNNITSQTQHGVIEEILLQAGMTDAAADALAKTTLFRKSWSKTRLDRNVEPEPINGRGKDQLEIVFYGYAATLRNRYTTLTGTENAASNLVNSIIKSAQFISPGSIQTNTLNYHVDDREAYRAWDLLRDITLAGDANGNRWMCGVYAGRRFNYERAPNNYVARLRDGNLLNAAGGPLQGWLAQPGLIALDDIPVAPGSPTGRGEDDPKAAWVDEVSFDLSEWLDTGYGVNFRRGVA